MLFEFSVESYIMSCLGDFSNVKNEDELIDYFYGVAGYVRACNLDSSYESRSPYYIDFITRILLLYTTFPEFDAYKYVWLVDQVCLTFINYAFFRHRVLCNKFHI